MAAQRYPDDYDGIVSLYPVLNWIPKALKDHEDTKAVLAQQGSGWISPETFAVIKKVVTDTCLLYTSVAAAVKPSLLGLAHIINSFITYLVSILSCIALPRFVLLVRAFHRTRVGLLPAYTF